MINYLSKYQWLYQYSIFVDVLSLELDDAKELAITWLSTFDDDKFKTYLRKKNKDIAMMYVIRKTFHKRHSSGKQFQQVYLTIYATDLLDGIENAQNYSDCFLNTRYRKITENKIQSTCRTLKNQRLHNLNNLGSKQRFTILNKSKLVPCTDQVPQ